MMKVVPSASVTFCCYEIFKKMLFSEQNEKIC